MFQRMIRHLGHQPVAFVALFIALGGGAMAASNVIHVGDTAGGDLTGTYPNPTIAAGKVTNGDLANPSLAIAAGTGLTGGGSIALGGSGSLSLDPAYQLPQNCSNAQVTKWNGIAWTCGDDNNTTYSAGTGIDLTGNTFGLDAAYQLPQNCGNGQLASWNGSAWTCASQPASSLPTVYRSSVCCGGGPGTPGVDLNGFSPITVTWLQLPAGDYVITGKATVDNEDQDVQIARCGLSDGSKTLDESEDEIQGLGEFPFTGNNPDRQVLTTMATAILPQGGIVSLYCETYDGGAGDAALIAMPVDAVN